MLLWLATLTGENDAGLVSCSASSETADHAGEPSVCGPDFATASSSNIGLDAFWGDHRTVVVHLIWHMGDAAPFRINALYDGTLLLIGLGFRQPSGRKDARMNAARRRAANLSALPNRC